MKIWIVVEIDGYGGDGLDCWCTFRDYSGLKVCYTEAERDKEIARIESIYAASAEVEEVTLKERLT